MSLCQPNLIHNFLGYIIVRHGISWGTKLEKVALARIKSSAVFWLKARTSKLSFTLVHNAFSTSQQDLLRLQQNDSHYDSTYPKSLQISVTNANTLVKPHQLTKRKELFENSAVSARIVKYLEYIRWDGCCGSNECLQLVLVGRVGLLDSHQSGSPHYGVLVFSLQNAPVSFHIKWAVPCRNQDHDCSSMSNQGMKTMTKSNNTVRVPRRKTPILQQKTWKKSPIDIWKST